MGSETLLKDNAIKSPAVDAWKASGKKVVGTICCHVPEELVDAAGMLPVRIRATGCAEDSEAETWMSPFSCSFARGNLQYLLNGEYDFLDGIASSDGCLLAGRVHDNWKYAGKDKIPSDYMLYQINAPRIIESPGDRTLNYYTDELMELKSQLEKLSGNEITDDKLTASIDKYNETRALIRKLYDLRKEKNPVISGTETLQIILSAMSMPKDEFNKQLAAFLEDAKNREPITDYRARLMIIGSALDDPEYIKVIEDQGGLVVTDVQCFGSRYLWEPVELGAGSVMDSLAKSYFTRPTCPRMIDVHNKIYQVFTDMIKDFGVQGVVYVRMKYCEVWGGESVFFEDKFKQAGIPYITLEREEIMTNAGQLAVRVEAFIEMIEGEDK